MGDALDSNAIRALQGGVRTDTPLDEIYRGCATPKGRPLPLPLPLTPTPNPLTPTPNPLTSNPNPKKVRDAQGGPLTPLARSIARLRAQHVGAQRHRRHRPGAQGARRQGLIERRGGWAADHRYSASCCF